MESNESNYKLGALPVNCSHPKTTLNLDFLQTETSEAKLESTRMLVTSRPFDRHPTCLCLNQSLAQKVTLQRASGQRPQALCRS